MKLEQPTEHFLILIVDDEEMNRDMLSKRLLRKGYQVHTAEDGFAAQEMIKKSQYDLILLDIMMPRLSGLEVLHTLRKTHDAFELPILMATAKAEEDDLVTALRLGANDYITKPINFPIALARIESILSQRESTLRLETQAERLQAIMAHNPDMISIHKPDGQFLFVSEAARPLLGFSPTELKAKSLFQLIHADDLKNNASKSPLQRDQHKLVARIQHKSGGWIWVELHTHSVRGLGGQITEVHVTTREMSRWVQAQTD